MVISRNFANFAAYFYSNCFKIFAMKHHLILLAALLSITMSLIAQNTYQTNLKGVTIYSNGAQVNREKTVALKAGEQTISFTGLSPYIDKNSLQVKAKGSVTVLGVSQRFIRPDSTLYSDQMRAVQHKIDEATQKVNELRAQRDVLMSQLKMVEANCNTSSRTAVTSLNEIKLLNNYYYDEMMSIKKKLIALEDEEEKANEVLTRQTELADSIAGIKLKRVAVVDVKVDARQQTSALFSLQYYVSGASWYPTYDVRSSSVNEPLQLSYKANILQHTNEDWTNVPVTLSTANPNRSNVSPDLRTYWLDYGLAAPTYEFGIDNNQISGTIYDIEDNSPLVGASVSVAGTQIGTVTDIDGHYSLTVPNGNRMLRVDYIGYESQQTSVSSSHKDFHLTPSQNYLQEVAVVGYGKRSRGRSKAAAAEEMAAAPAPSPRKAARVVEEEDIEVVSTAAKFGYEFEVKHPLTIPSDNKPVSALLGRYELPTTYAYKGVPRIDKDAFLMADATGWEELNLVEGEANIFFDNSYVGKTILDPIQSDTLHLAMGRDNGIQINRKLVKNNSTHKVFSTNQTQKKDWEINIRNTRAEKVSIKIYDQIPVSQNSNITVNAEELSGGILDAETGIVVWDLTLNPGETRQLKLSYEVKYPKSRRLNVE